MIIVFTLDIWTDVKQHVHKSSWTSSKWCLMYVHITSCVLYNVKMFGILMPDLANFHIFGWRLTWILLTWPFFVINFLHFYLNEVNLLYSKLFFLSFLSHDSSLFTINTEDHDLDLDYAHGKDKSSFDIYIYIYIYIYWATIRCLWCADVVLQ